MSTTNINDLPLDPIGGGNNVSIMASETVPMNGNNLDESTIHQIVSGIQQASVAGATSLPSRDIPQNTEHIIRDPQIQPNYVPPPPVNKSDYIMNENITDHYSKEENRNDQLDAFYDEFQTPLLLSVLYFMFQLPIFKATLCRYISFLCKPDGNYNLNGYLFTSILFSAIYYFLMKVVSQFNRF
jgi:hypothetical protein